MMLKKMNNTVLSYVGMVVVVLIWGTAFLFNTSALKQYSPIMLVAVRGLVSVIVLCACAGKRLKLINASYLKIAIPTGLMLAGGYITQLMGLTLTTPAKNGFYSEISCVVVPALMIFLTRQTPSFLKIIFSILCLLGIGVIGFKGGALADMFYFNIGDVLSLASGVFYAGNIAVTAVYAKNKDTFVYTSIQFVALTIAAFALSPLLEEVRFSWNVTGLLNILYLGVFCTAVCFLLRVACLKNVDATVVSVVMPFSAVITGVLSVSIGMEGLTWNLVVGGLLMIATIIGSELCDVHSKKKKEKNDATKSNADVLSPDEVE